MAPATAPACGCEKKCVSTACVGELSICNQQISLQGRSSDYLLQISLQSLDFLQPPCDRVYSIVCFVGCVQTFSRLALNGFQPFPFRSSSLDRLFHVERHQSATATAYVDVSSNIYLMCSHGPKLAGT